MLLSFNVQKQIITRTDTESVVCNSMNFLYAQFTFSEEWTGTKTAVFKGKEKTYNALLDENDTCLVPWEVLTESWFYVSVFCGDLITANQVTIYTIPSGYEIGDESRIPTPEIYNQIIEKLDGINAESIPYDNTQSGMGAENVQEALDELAQGGGGGGSVVVVTPTLLSGTKIAEIDVDGTNTDLFAPSGGGSASSLSDLSDTSITSPSSGDVLVYDGEKWENGVVNTPKNNLFVVAHRGLSTSEIPENTIAAFKNAIRDGYSWIEIDVRRTQDYVYILAHDVSMTLYKNGVAETVDFANTPYSQLLDYTWDAAGNYHVDTLDNALFALKNMNVNVIIDNKVGGDYHIEMIREARQYGMCERCVVSVSLADLTTFLDEIKPFPDARLRVVDVTDATQFKQVASEITNDIYLDMHAEMAGHWNTRLPLLLSLGYPIIAAGYNKGTSHDTYRKHIINCVAGIMSDQNLTYRDFVDTINSDLDVVASMITSPQRVALTDEAVALNAQNTETGAGYINMYSTDDSIASVVCTQRGESAISTITPVNDGMCELYVFNPSITNKIPCVVSNNGAVGIIGDIGDDGTTFTNTSTKLSYLGIDGDSVIKTINRLMRNYYSGKGYYGDFYLMEVPEGATRFTANVDTAIEDTYLYVKFFDSAKTRVLASAWSQTKDITIESNYKYIAIGCRIGNGTTPLRQNDIVNEHYDKVVSSVSFEFT